MSSKSATADASCFRRPSSADFAPHSLPTEAAEYDGRSQRRSTPHADPEELEKLSGAETLFPSPIPVQFVSSDEYMPSRRAPSRRSSSAHQESGSNLAKKAASRPVLQDRRRHGGCVRGDERSARQGRPTSLRSGEGRNHSDVAQARADSLKNQFVMDMHTHFLREGTPIRTFVAQRETVGKAGWNPRKDKPQTIEDLMFPNYVKEIFLDSDTKVACISARTRWTRSSRSSRTR